MIWQYILRLRYNPRRALSVSCASVQTLFYRWVLVRSTVGGIGLLDGARGVLQQKNYPGVGRVQSPRRHVGGENKIYLEYQQRSRVMGKVG